MKTGLKKFIFYSLKTTHQYLHAVVKGVAQIHQTMSLWWSRQVCTFRISRRQLKTLECQVHVIRTRASTTYMVAPKK